MRNKKSILFMWPRIPIDGVHIRVKLLPSFAGFFVGMLKPIEDFHSLGLDHTTDGWLQLTLTLTTLVSRVKGYPAAA